MALYHQHAYRHGALCRGADIQQRLGWHLRRLLLAAVEHAQDARALGLGDGVAGRLSEEVVALIHRADKRVDGLELDRHSVPRQIGDAAGGMSVLDRKSTRLNSTH